MFTPSRGMISGELSWAWIAICFVISGVGGPTWIYHGPLYVALEGSNDRIVWAILLGVPSVLLTILSWGEWHSKLRGDFWSPEKVYDYARWRGTCCFWMIPGWMYALKTVFIEQGVLSLPSMIAAGGVVFMWWFYKESRRVRREIRQSNNSRGIPA